MKNEVTLPVRTAREKEILEKLFSLYSGKIFDYIPDDSCDVNDYTDECSILVSEVEVEESLPVGTKVWYSRIPGCPKSAGTGIITKFEDGVYRVKATHNETPSRISMTWLFTETAGLEVLK